MGYQIVEIEQIDALVASGHHQPLAVAAYAWLIPQIRRALGNRIDGVAIHIVWVKYMDSAYPGLGVKYLHADPQIDLGKEVELAVNQILSVALAIDFLHSVGRSEQSWAGVLSQLVEEGSISVPGSE